MTRSALFDPGESMEWQHDGLCVGCDPDLFFPAKWDFAATKAAKAVCAVCPVRAECLSYALRHNEPVGIWGGCTTKQRRIILKQRRTAA